LETLPPFAPFQPRKISDLQERRICKKPSSAGPRNTSQSSPARPPGITVTGMAQYEFQAMRILKGPYRRFT